MSDGPGNTSFGERLRHHRERAGMTRPVLGGLVGRSAEWVKAVETDRIKQPRLPMLIRLAELLDVADLAELTGEQRLTRTSYAKSAHASLSTITKALAAYPLTADDTEPASAGTLLARIGQAWELWHGARRQRTAVATVLPGLLHDARVATRLLDGSERRRALTALAQTYHLAQLYLSFQPAPELVLLTGDRAMNAAQDADDPNSMAVAAWYVNHVYRDAGEQHEARVELARDVAGLLRPADGAENLARWGLLQLAIALSFAKVGQEGDAWRYWDEASKAADALGSGYAHPWLIFGRGMVDAYAITIHADLMHGGEAVRQADRVGLAEMPSETRRSFHYAETARAHHLRHEPVATVAMLRKAHTESPDTFRFSLFARSVVPDLVACGGTTVRGDAEVLAGHLGLTL